MKILVVEDDPVIAQTLQLLFSSYAYAVDIAADGEAGLRMAEAYDYDLILLDLLLPRLDGVSLCQQLRAKGFQNPILLLTGQGGSQQKAIALNAGADDYVVKPFDAEELIARIQALLRRGGQTSQPILTWGQLAVDPSSRNVAYSAHLLSLTPKEYAILELFLRHPHRVHSARAILDHVWTSLESPGEEAVRVHIKELRQKLTAAGAAKDFIKTKHRSGYQLNPLYSSLLAPKATDQVTAPQLAELNAVNEELRLANEELRITLEQLQSTQAELQRNNQELQIARNDLEQRVAEQTAELRQREEFLSSIYHGVAQTIFVVDVTAAGDFRYVSFNPLAEEIIGQTTQALQGKTPEEAFGSTVGSRFRQHYERCLQTEMSITYEEQIPFENHPLWALTTLSPLRDAEGAIYRIVGTAVDISDRKQIEESLVRSEERARLATQVARLGTWNYSLSTAQVELDSRMREIWGVPDTTNSFTIAEIVARIHPQDQERVMATIQTALHQRSLDIYEVECRIVWDDGSEHWVFANGQAQVEPTEARQVESFVGTALDITAIKQAEIKLQQQIRQEYLLTDIAQEIRHSLNLDEVLSSTVHRVREFLDTDRVIIFRFRPDWQGEVIMESVGSGWGSILSTTITDPCFRDHYLDPYRQGRIATLANIETEPLEPCYVELLASFQVQANLVVPILQNDQLWGLLIAHQCSAPRQWQQNEVALLRRLATQVGIAIQQSELYEQTQRELTARQQIQTVLAESEERFRTLSAAAPIGILQTSADGICLYSNARWQEISGLSSAESLGDGWLQTIHPDDRAAVFTAWDEYLYHEGEFNQEFRLLTPQGDLRWISAHISEMLTSASEVIGHVCTLEDITDRKRAEAALRDSEQRLQAILDNSPAAVYLLDTHHNYLLVNRICAELASKTPEEFIGRNVYDIWPAEVADTFVANNQIVLETRQLLQVEEVAPHPDGELHTHLTIKFPLCDATGMPYAMCGISTDITEKKQLEAQFYRAQRLESLGTLASGIAHDLNNVLTPILTISQLLRLNYPGLDERAREMVKVLEDSAKRGANLIQQILAFTRGTGGERSPIQVTSVLHELIQVMRQSFPKSIEIYATIPDPFPWLVSADATYLHQVLMNLCINARDAMPEGGNLTLTVDHFFVDQTFAQNHLNAHAGDYVVITVTDSGSGIPVEMRDRIFDPFFTTKPHGQGTGLGLPTALAIVRSYGGFLQVLTEENHGTQIKVYLPATVTEALPDTIQSESLSDGNGALVLIVDDDEAVQLGTQVLLESHHYRTLVASHGTEAIGLYREQQADIKAVILDIMMPDMSGIILIERLRSINPQVKILAMSGLSVNQKSALDAGATIFLAKPYASETLLEVVSDLTSN